MEQSSKSIIESLLYVVGNDGITIADIKRVLNLSSDDIKSILREIKRDCDTSPHRGVTIECYDGNYKLLTKPENIEKISLIFNVKNRNPLTSSLLETLAIIAYNSPCPGNKIEQIRGHNAASAIDKLIKLNLIKNIGRADTPGRPYLYEVTNKFFDIFGIKSLKDLPNIDKEWSSLEDQDLSEDFFKKSEDKSK